MLGAGAVVLSACRPSAGPVLWPTATWTDPSPHRVQFVVVSPGVRLEVLDWGGSGPPLVFVPGLSDSGLSFVQPIARLADHFRCIALDLPTGRGDGARLRNYRHDDLVKDLFGLLDHLKVSQSYIFGSSFGSTIALRAMHERPERLPRGILQGGFAWRPLAPAEVWLSRLVRYWSARMGSLPGRKKALRRSHFGPFVDRPPEVWDFFLERTGLAPLSAVATHALLLHGVDLRPLLSKIRQPVLLVTGDRDPLVKRWCTEQLLEGLPNARPVEFDGCGHFPMFSHPELLAEVVRDFLTPPAEQLGSVLASHEPRNGAFQSCNK